MDKTMRSYFYMLLLLTFESFAGADPISVQLYYEQGKAFFEAGQDQEAEAVLSLVPMSDNVYGRKSQYILAASFSRQGQFEKAHDCFAQIMKAKIQSVLDRSLSDLSVLGKARLYYQQNKMRDAVLAYQRLGLDSIYASIMLYELGMTYIHYGDAMLAQPMRAKKIYQSAARTLDQLFKLDKNVIQDPRVILMAVDIFMRLGEGEKAAILYRQLLHILMSIQKTLQDASNQTNELAKTLLAKQNDAENLKIFSWVYSHVEVKNNLKQLHDILQAKADIQKTRVHYEAFLQTLLSDGREATLIESVQQQIVNLDRLLQLANTMELESSSSFLRIVKDSLPLWLEQINWLLAGTNSGLVRSVLREQYQQEENIRQIEMIKAKELSKIKKEFEMSHGGPL